MFELHCLEEKGYDEEDALVRPVNVISTCETCLKSGCQSATSNCIQTEGTAYWVYDDSFPICAKAGQG